MISSIGTGASAPPSMSSLQAMRQQAFSRADTSGNGALDAAEFKGLMAQAPGGKGPPGMADADAAFKSADADRNGELSSAELEQGMQRTMASFQSTLSLASAPAGGNAGAGTGQDAWKTLLDALQTTEGSRTRSHAAAQAYGGGAAPRVSLTA